MTPAEISEHAKKADEWWGQLYERTIVQAIQHGINLAVESKDRRISELERDCKIWVDEVNEQITELQSKDREIERLKEALSLEESNSNGLSECFIMVKDVFAHYGEDCSCTPPMMMDDAAKVLLGRLTSKLTEANAKLAEAEYDRKSTEINKALVTAVIETQVAQEAIDLVARERDDLQSKLSSAQADCETWRKHALALEESGNRSQAEIERLKGEIIEDTSAQDAEDRREEESQRLRDLHIGRNT